MNPIKDKKILITGGAGFVGSFIADQLIDKGVGEIVIIDNFVRGKKENLCSAMASGRVKLITGDIRNNDLLRDSLSGIDYCFHLAALRINQCAQEPREALTVMYDGTFNVFEACVANRVKKLIFASTASVYGQAERFPTKENHHPYNNTTLYGAAKMAGELMLRSFRQMHGLSYVALRYFNIIGPRMDVYGKYTEVIVRWYHLIKKGEAPVIYGTGKQKMDWVYVEDIARASVLALRADVEGDVFNIGTGKETSLEDICYLLLEVMKSPLKPKYVPLPHDRSKVEVMRRKPDVKKAKRALSFTAKVEVKEALKELVAWLDKQESHA